MAGIIFTLLVTVAAQARNLPACQQLFFGDLLTDVQAVIPDNALTFSSSENFLIRYREQMVRHYIKLPSKSGRHSTFMGLSASIFELQEILSMGIRPLSDRTDRDVDENIRNAGLQSLLGKSTSPYLSIIVEINALRCIGCFTTLRLGTESNRSTATRVVRRVHLHAIENVYVLTGGLRPSYVPLDLSSLRARSTEFVESW